MGQSDLGKGWTARANINYITSFRFRQEWSESYSDIVGSEIHSVGFVNKNWSSYHGQRDLRAPAEFPVFRNQYQPWRSAAQLRGQRGDHPQTPRSGIQQPYAAHLGPGAGLFFLRFLGRSALPLRAGLQFGQHRAGG